MTVTSTCPRCSGSLRAPGLMSSSWECTSHGQVAPYRRAAPSALARVLTSATVPVWSPHLLHGWTLAGVSTCGDDRSGATAVAVALSGPSPLGGPADLVLVSEEPGSSLGARCAGIDDLDPGECTHGAPDAKILVAGHPTPLWRCSSTPDCVAYAGEAAGVWLWAVLWPPEAELVLLEHVELQDLRRDPVELPWGAPSTRLP